MGTTKSPIVHSKYLESANRLCFFYYFFAGNSKKQYCKYSLASFAVTVGTVGF